MEGLRTWLEQWTAAQYLVVSGILVVVPAGAGPFLDLPWSAICGALAAVALVAAAAGWWIRQQAARLPLVLARKALRGRVDGRTVYRFRAILGRGRPMTDATATVMFVPEDGDRVELAPLVPGGRRLLGPWTVAVVDRAGTCAGQGTFEVHVRVQERGQTWEARGAWRSDQIEEGRFVEVVAVRGGKLAFKLDDFERTLGG